MVSPPLVSMLAPASASAVSLSSAALSSAVLSSAALTGVCGALSEELLPQPLRAAEMTAAPIKMELIDLFSSFYPSCICLSQNWIAR